MAHKAGSPAPSRAHLRRCAVHSPCSTPCHALFAHQMVKSRFRPKTWQKRMIYTARVLRVRRAFFNHCPGSQFILLHQCRPKLADGQAPRKPAAATGGRRIWICATRQRFLRRATIHLLQRTRLQIRTILTSRSDSPHAPWRFHTPRYNML